VRNSWVTHSDREAAGFFDAADQEEVKRESNAAIKQWIDDQLENTSVTAVLIGEETADRDFVQYEIAKSIERGNALLGIRIDSLKNKQGRTGSRGENPLAHYVLDTRSEEVPLSDIFSTYRWKEDNGKQNISKWVEEAVQNGSAVPNSTQAHLHHKPERTDDTLLDVALKTGMIVGGAKILADIAKQFGNN